MKPSSFGPGHLRTWRASLSCHCQVYSRWAVKPPAGPDLIINEALYGKPGYVRKSPSITSSSALSIMGRARYQSSPCFWQITSVISSSIRLTIRMPSTDSDKALVLFFSWDHQRSLWDVSHSIRDDPYFVSSPDFT